MVKNVFFCSNIFKCGGIETFEYYIARKYANVKDVEIELWYKNSDPEQLKQMQKYAKCVKFTGQQIVCDNFFFPSRNCGDILDHVKANNIIECFHMDAAFNWNTKTDSRVNRYLAVSQHGAKVFEKATNKKCDCYYPIIEFDRSIHKNTWSDDGVLRLVSVGRFDTPDKGAARMKLIADKLDQKGIKWEWTIFGIDNKLFNNKGFKFKGIILDKEELFKEVIKSDFGVQLSDAEGFGISISEFLNLGMILVSTPISVINEHLTNEDNCILYNFDGSNVDEVIDKMLNNKKQVLNYIMPKSNWDELLLCNYKFINCWWSEDVWNAGDYFGHWLLNKVGVYNTYNSKHDIVACGSILGFGTLTKDSVVWGAGFHNETDIKKPLLKNILAVRGYNTISKIEKDHNVKINNMPVGDPGLLASKFYTPITSKKYDYGIVCHYIDYKDMYEKYKDSNIKLINMATHDIEGLLNEINECRFIFSSSLHGLVFSHSLGIPCVHLEIKPLASKNNWKFKDYYSVFKDVKYVKEVFNNNFDFIDKYLNDDTNKYLPKKEEIEAIQDNLLKKIYEYRNLRNC